MRSVTATPAQPGKVCVVARDDYTHDGRTLRATRALTAWGCQVVVLVLKNPHTPRLEVREGVRIRRAEVFLRRLPKWPPLLPFKLAEWALRLLAMLVQERPQVVHCCLLEPMPVALAAARLVGARVLFDPREITAERVGYHHLPPAVKRLVVGFERAMARRADAVIEVSPERAALFAQRCGIPAPPVVGNYSEFRPLERTDLLRRTLGLPPGAPIALYQGLLRADRGLVEAIEAIERAPAGVLVIMGFGGYRRNLEMMVRRRGLADRVRFLDAVPPGETVRWAASADLGLVTLKNTCLNNYYAAPGKLYDYLMAGLPVIVSDFPGLRPIAQRGAGIAVDPEQPAQIADALNRLFADDALRQRMGRRARELAETEYNWGRASRVLREVYERLCAPR